MRLILRHPRRAIALGIVAVLLACGYWGWRTLTTPQGAQPVGVLAGDGDSSGQVPCGNTLGAGTGRGRFTPQWLKKHKTQHQRHHHH